MRKNLRFRLIHVYDDLFYDPPKWYWDIKVAKEHSFLGFKFYGPMFMYKHLLTDEECTKEMMELTKKYSCFRKDKIEGWESMDVVFNKLKEQVMGKKVEKWYEEQE